MVKNSDLLVVGALLAFTFVQGCSTNVKKVHRASLDMQPISSLNVELQALEDIDVAMDGPGYDGTQLAASMNQSVMSTPATSPGYTPEAGLAGALVGGLVAAKFSESVAQSSKNKPVNAWLETLEEVDWSPVMLAAARLSADDGVSIRVDGPHQGEGSVMRLRPNLEVVSNYMSLELHTLVEVFNAAGDLVYTNYFHVQSQPLIDRQMLLSDLNDRTEQDAMNFVEPLMAMTIQLAQGDYMSPAKVGGAPQSIRFSNYMGKYFEMGHLLNEDDGYITFKTLRGEVKHYPTTQLSESDTWAGA